MTPTQQGVVSSCCSASIYENTDVCMNCKEHCTAVDEDELKWLGENWNPKKVTHYTNRSK